MTGKRESTFAWKERYVLTKVEKFNSTESFVPVKINYSPVKSVKGDKRKRVFRRFSTLLHRLAVCIVCIGFSMLSAGVLVDVRKQNANILDLITMHRRDSYQIGMVWIGVALLSLGLFTLLVNYIDKSYDNIIRFGSVLVLLAMIASGAVYLLYDNECFPVLSI